MTENERDSFPERRGDWMQTYSGRRFWPLDPRPEDVVIEDIAHALALQSRFGGHCLRFYSVAEHSVHLARAASSDAALWLLLHDASEAYLSDMVRPLKRHMPEYRKVEDQVAWVVFQAFGLDPGMEPAEVKALDSRILIDERIQNIRPTGDAWNYGGATQPLGINLQFWPPEQAEREFLATFAVLTTAVPTPRESGRPRPGCIPRTAREERVTMSDDHQGASGAESLEALKAREAELEKAINEAPVWGAAVGARAGELRDVQRRIARLSASAPVSGAESLDLRDLHAANIARQAEWCPDQVPDLSFRGNELAGETGEACNVIKKLERERQGWRGSRATKADLAQELADVVICADLCAVTAGIDLAAAVTEKFNATSEKQGLSVFLPTPATNPGVPEEVRADALRYRYLRERRSYHYGPGYAEPSPAECGIEWQWQQSKPNETGDIDALIDEEIAALDPEERALLTEAWGAAHPAGQRGETRADDSDDGTDRCIACAEPLQAGEHVLDDVNGGVIHAACCGPERESYAGADGEPLRPNDPIPQGYVYDPLWDAAVARDASLTNEEIAREISDLAKDGRGVFGTVLGMLNRMRPASPAPTADRGRDAGEGWVREADWKKTLGESVQLAFQHHPVRPGFWDGEAWVTIGCITEGGEHPTHVRPLAYPPSLNATPAPAGAPTGGWQLIETAPTNRAVQVYVPGLDYYGNEGVYAGMLVDMGTGRRWMTFAFAMGRDMCGENRPTHWRPLPAPPPAGEA